MGEFPFVDAAVALARNVDRSTAALVVTGGAGSNGE